MAEVSALDRSRIQEIIRLALDPDMVFPSYVEKVRCRVLFFEYPTGSALIKAECLVPLAFVQDEVGKRWLYDNCEKKMSMRTIADKYRTNHKVVSRRIQYVLDKCVDEARNQVADYIIDVYYTHFGKTRPEELKLEPIGRRS